MTKEDTIITIFEEVKSICTARVAAEYYGLKGGRNGMACCPFHGDQHPSMKIDSFYFCFACGAKGDAVGYVAQLFGLNQYEAACKIVEDLKLPIKLNSSKANRKVKKDWNAIREKKHQEKRRTQFRKWCCDSVDSLKQTSGDIKVIKDHIQNLLGVDAIDDETFCDLIQMDAVISTWLDVLCIGTEEDKMELFLEARKEVTAYQSKVRDIRRQNLGEGDGDA